MDNGGTAAYLYDAQDHRVQATVNGTTTKTAYNIYGHRTSIWDASGTPVAFFAYGPIYYYHHQDWLGTERMRTTYNGTVEGSCRSI